MDDLRLVLKEGLHQLAIPANTLDIDRLLNYVDYLARWNQIYNLTAIRSPSEMIIKHVLDSLSIYSLIEGNRCIDVGTGAGLPGLILALMLPDIEFALLDSQIKKTTFLNRMVRELALKNVRVYHERVENHRPEILYDMILSRAFASLTDMLNCTQHLRAEKGCFLAMKGQKPDQEVSELNDKNMSIEIIPLQVPFLHASRHALIVTIPP